MRQEQTKAMPLSPSPHPFKHNNFMSQMNQIIAGAASSIATRVFIQPLAVIKIRFQLQIEPLHSDFAGHSKYTSMLQATRLIYKEEGITAFWKGHMAGQGLSIVYGVSQFWAYEQILFEFRQTRYLGARPNVNRFVSGALSGFISTVVSMPFDVIRTRIISQDEGRGYRNSRHAFRQIYRHEGIPGLFRGLGATLILIPPLTGGNFAIYGLLNDLAMKVLKLEHHSQIPSWILLFSGGVAGTVSKLMVYPMDLIKRRLQVQGFQEHRKTFGKNTFCDGIISCVMLTFREESAWGFYKGMAPSVIKSGVSTALSLGFYDKCKDLLNEYEE